ncbi:MAG: dTMP kinase [Candidatus Micrarchaeia archaeon]
MPEKGVFIVVEGIDGSGKGFITSRLQEYVMNRSKKYDHVLVTREPTHGRFGQRIREILRSEKDPYAGARQCLELYVNDRREHLRNHIEPALAKGYVVLCDRYKYSTIAFQQAQGIPLAELMASQQSMRSPDLVLLLDLPAKIGLERVREREGKEGNEKFEQLEFAEKVRQNYLDVARLFPTEKIFVVDASKTREEVWAQVKKIVDDSGVLPY